MLHSVKNKPHREKGTSILEFAIIASATVFMLLGVVVVGLGLGRAVQAAQVCRDAGSMYVRGVDFSQSGNQAELARMAQALNLQTGGGGDGIVILSKVTFIPDPSSSCGVPADAGYATCAVGAYRLSQRIIFGNTTALPATHFPTEAAVTLDSEGNVSNYADFKNGTAATIDNFQTTISLYPAQFSYVSETYFRTVDLNMPGFQSNPGIYSVSFF